MFNEMSSDDGVFPHYRAVQQWLVTEGDAALLQRREEAERLFRQVGITFAVYGQGGDPERLIPFDLVPRVFTAREWQIIERGCLQRASALNAFLADVYGAREIVRAGIVPADAIDDNPAYLRIMRDIRPVADVWAHIVGIDIVRTGPDDFMVLEDNARTPSGVSYMLENREAMMRMFPALFKGGVVRPVDDYPELLAQAMGSCAPAASSDDPVTVVLTPGYYNSAYYEHAFLADRMGVQLVEGQDLFVNNDRVWMRTIHGPRPVDVIYRRIDDDFLDPTCFNPTSQLGVPGLMDVYRNGGVTLCNAPGTGICDDKATYVYVPEMIRFYLGEEPILKNVPTWRCAIDIECAHVLANLDNMVVKETHGSGGYGMLIGPKSTKAECEAYGERIKADPAGFIAQPTLDLSAAPTLTDDGLGLRHVDLRPYVVCGRDGPRLTPGGLTRVALREGSLVVNSSQGGGVKDTWVLRGDTSC